MSTQTPITTEPTACSTSWYTRIACRLQRFVDPLCEKRSDFALNLLEHNTLVTDIRVCNKILGYQGNAEYSSLQWLRIINDNGLVCSEATIAMLQPRLTLWNKIGLWFWKGFSVGTECSCCLGFRVAFVAVTGGAIGFLIGRLV